MTLHTGNKRLLWQHLTTMVIDKIRKMSIKGVKLRGQSLSIGERGVEGKRKFIRKISPPSEKCMYNLKPQQNIQKYFHAPVKKPDTSRH